MPQDHEHQIGSMTQDSGLPLELEDFNPTASWLATRR